MSFPENKKSSPWKVFGINHPQTLQLLSRRGPRCTVTRLSQHYIGPAMKFCYISNFCRKKIFCTYWMNLEVLSHDFFKLQSQKVYKNVGELFVKLGNLFFDQCDVETASRPGLYDFFCWKVTGFEGGLFEKTFQGQHFFVFWGTHLVDIFLSYFPMKQIWRKSTVWYPVRNWVGPG